MTIAGSGLFFGGMYLLYSVLSVVALVIASPFLVYQAVRHRKYVRSLRQRLGYLPLSFNIDGDESIWIHAVSVGETLTARALIGDLKSRYPGPEAVPLDHDHDRPRSGPGAHRSSTASSTSRSTGASPSAARWTSSGRACS